jgi:hypothetical protein
MVGADSEGKPMTFLHSLDELETRLECLLPSEHREPVRRAFDVVRKADAFAFRAGSYNAMADALLELGRSLTPKTSKADRGDTPAHAGAAVDDPGKEKRASVSDVKATPGDSSASQGQADSLLHRVLHHEVDVLEAALELEEPAPVATQAPKFVGGVSPTCWCVRCDEATDPGPDAWISLGRARMNLCPDCGNKRCPKATFHELACTNSNEPGQEGSVFR